MNTYTDQSDTFLSPSNESWEIPGYLLGVSSLAVALLSSDAQLLQANQGFYQLVGAAESWNKKQDVRHLFIKPSFDQLLDALPDPRNGRLYDGLLTFGSTVQLNGSHKTFVYRSMDRLLLVSERDMSDLERRNELVLRLNRGLDELHRAALRRNRLCKRHGQLIQELVDTDQLTHVANRRGLDTHLLSEIDRAGRMHRPLSVLMVDIDHFKKVNDSYGHPVGDIVLRQIADILRDSARSMDFVTRYGGEEFVMLLPESPLDMARNVAERIRQRVEGQSFGQITHPITISLGVAQWREEEDAEQLLARVDTALYQSKQQGRNRVSSLA
jgi:diguanylate cyclase (GGDEF)-like protein